VVLSYVGRFSFQGGGDEFEPEFFKVGITPAHGLLPEKLEETTTQEARRNSFY
jgi:hypothetical protein